MWPMFTMKTLNLPFQKSVIIHVKTSECGSFLSTCSLPMYFMPKSSTMSVKLMGHHSCFQYPVSQVIASYLSSKHPDINYIYLVSCIHSYSFIFII